MLAVVAIAAPVIPQPNHRIIIGSRITFSMFPKIWPIIAALGCSSARIIPPHAIENNTNGAEAITIDK